METEGIRPPPGVESRMAHATGVEIHRARSDRGMSLFGKQPHTLKARLWSMNLDGLFVGGSIGVRDESTAARRHCLRITDR
jgi:hypothetical protein